MFSTWCSHCSKQKKDDERKKQKEEAMRQKEKDAQEQEKFFEEARRKMLEEEQKRYADYANLFSNWPSYAYIYSQSNNGLNDDSINLLASQNAKRDLANQMAENYDDLVFMHKILLTSKEMLVAKFLAIPKEELASFYRKSTIRLHPDKNSHPQAREAFQKFTECYRICEVRKEQK